MKYLKENMKERHTYNALRIHRMLILKWALGAEADV